MWPFHVCFSWIFKCLISVREWISKKQICNSNAGNYTSTNLKLYIQILYLKFEIHIDLINEMSCSQFMCLHTPTISPGEESDKVFSTIFIHNFSPSFSILLGSWCDLVQPLGCSINCENHHQCWYHVGVVSRSNWPGWHLGKTTEVSEDVWLNYL